MLLLIIAHFIFSLFFYRRRLYDKNIEMFHSQKGGKVMDIFTTIRERRSCRIFLPDPIGDDVIERILEAAVWAPSAANNQPWEFIVITNKSVKKEISSESEKCRKILFEKSGWKWVDRYRISFLEEAPVIITVVGDPRKTGADMFLEGGGLAYRDGCAAAIQNLLLAAHTLELGTLWFTLFDKEAIRRILKLDKVKEPLALICLGKAGATPAPPPREVVAEKTVYLR
jgi:nitroreductase